MITAINFLDLALEDRLFLIYRYASVIAVDHLQECSYHRLEDFYVVVLTEPRKRKILDILPFTGGIYYQRMVNWVSRRSYS